jgi:hypothetical protein
MDITHLVNCRAYSRFTEIDNYQFSESELLSACELISEIEEKTKEYHLENEIFDEPLITEEEIFEILENCKD